MTESDKAPIVELENVSYRYPGGGLALDRLTCCFEDGERVGLVGPSGAGKSTLLMHLNGLLPADGDDSRLSDSSLIRIDGVEIERSSLKTVRRTVGFLFQDPDDQLFCPTVEEDVAFGPLNLGLGKSVVVERVRECLAAVGLEDYAGRSTLQLSVGERKRVCLAGLFACQPKVLALDEPFSNLDPRARRGLIEILSDFPGTQIIATHDLESVVELCDRVIVLDEGQLRADGAARTVLSDAALMERHGLEVPLRLQLKPPESRVRDTA